VGNWKMNMTVGDSLKFVTALTHELKAVGEKDVVIAPPFTALYSTGVALSETEYQLAAQNVHWEDSGAFTGEIAPPFLKDVGCTYVIIGHSERRQHFGETDEMVNLRLRAAMLHELIPIVCVGERLKERESNQTWEVLERQLSGAFSGISFTIDSLPLVAYEPVWAIGTGKTATPAQAQEVHAMIRDFLSNRFDATTSDAMRILYGGSVKPSNSREIMSQKDVDGVLVGGASLNPQHFAAIVRSAV
jgi:triosephosphate isomerase